MFESCESCFNETCAVSDKPSAPEGPLKVSDVNAKGCKLNWKPPADDGGVPIQKYVVEKMDEATGMSQSGHSDRAPVLPFIRILYVHFHVGGVLKYAVKPNQLGCIFRRREST